MRERPRIVLVTEGTSRLAPAAATFTFEDMTALPPPTRNLALPGLQGTRFRTDNTAFGLSSISRQIDDGTI